MTFVSSKYERVTPIQPAPRAVGIFRDNSDSATSYADTVFDAIYREMGAEAAAAWERLGPDAADVGNLRPYRGVYFRLYSPAHFFGTALHDGRISSGREAQASWSYSLRDKAWTRDNDLESDLGEWKEVLDEVTE